MQFLLFFLETSSPSFRGFYHSHVITTLENDNVSFTYSIAGNPYPNIVWFQKSGKKEKQLQVCKQKSCRMPDWEDQNIFITNSSFMITNLLYPNDNNVSYICLISNVFGNVSKWFSLFVQCKYFLHLFLFLYR